MKMPILENAVLYAKGAFLQNTDPKLPAGLETKEIGKGAKLPLATFSRELQQIISGAEKDKQRMDGTIAELLHRRFRLTRQEAAEMRFWHYMTIVQCPFYVVWRYFDEREGKVNRERYLGSLDRNALSRLWWFAELTAAGDSYEQTLRASQSGEFLKGIVENLLGGHHQLVCALIDLLFPGDVVPPDATVKEMFIKLNALLVTVAVDALKPAEIRTLIRQTYDNQLFQH